MTKRKFYKTIVKVEILSEEPFQWDTLEDVNYAITTHGGCSGVAEDKGTKILNGKQIASALLKQGSDPEFFGVDEKGNDCEKGENCE